MSLTNHTTVLSIKFLVVGAAAFWAGRVFEKNKSRTTTITKNDEDDDDESVVPDTTTSDISISLSSDNLQLPKFAKDLEVDEQLHRVRLREWEDLEWRKLNGWTGRDLCHNPLGSAVRVLSYYHNSSTNQMIGVVWFGPDAESHRGLCHGGAMTSLMDDFCGHMAFLNSSSPWSGATVQVNCSLKKPVPVGSILRIIGRVKKQEGRKISVEAVLDDGGSNSSSSSTTKKDDEMKNATTVDHVEVVVYATFEGLSIDGVKMSNHNDSVTERTWQVGVCEQSGRLQRRDSSFSINTK